MPEPRPAALRHALFPGSFDPVTRGHIDIVRRAAELFGRVTIAVASNSAKRELLPLATRLALLHEVTASIPGVNIAQVDGLTVEGARALGANVIVRGLRNASDFEYESQMALCNRAMASELETVFLPSSPEHAHISSTLVRQVAEMGGPVELFVPECVARALRERRAATLGHR